MTVALWTNEEIDSIRKSAANAELTGRWDKSVINSLYERKAFKLFVPEELGGTMTPLPEALRLFEQAAWIDGSYGWAMTIGSGGGYFVPFMQPDTARARFSDEKAVIAGSGMPTGRAVRTEGGYIVTGSWKYCSGARHASMFTANALVVEEEAQADSDVIQAFIFTPDQVRIVEDWHAFGMKATDSHSIEVVEAFVPADRTFNLEQTYDTYAAPLYRYGFMPFAETSFAAVVLGLGRHFLDEASSILERNRTIWENAKPGRVDFVEQLLQEGTCALNEAQRSFYMHVDRSWQELLHNGQLAPETEQEVCRQSKAAARSMLAMADSIFPYLGMGAVMQNSELNRAWRDLHTACQHTALASFER